MKVTEEQLEKKIAYPPKNPKDETEFQMIHRMGRNSMIFELQKEMKDPNKAFVQILSDEDIEHLALLENKKGWEHLYIGESLPKKPYPTLFEKEISGWIAGFKYCLKMATEME